MYLDATVSPYQDYLLAAAAAVMVAGVIISVTVLSRYRALAVEAGKSSQLAKDLWYALETRLKKQDDRLVDLMARVEIYDVRSQLGDRHSASKLKSVEIQPSSTQPVGTRVNVVSLDVEKDILESLVEGPRTSTQLKVIIGKSREHTARLMKILFDNGYVIRNDRNKPFVYEITDSGRRYLAESRSTAT